MSGDFKKLNTSLFHCAVSKTYILFGFSKKLLVYGLKGCSVLE